MNARAQLLAAVRTQLQIAHGGAPPATPPAPPPVPLLGAVDLELPARLQQFGDALRATAGQLHFAGGDTPASNIVAGILQAAGASTVAWSDAPPVQQLAAAVRAQLPGTDVRADAPRHELLACDAGVTGAQWGIAETGTLVLIEDAERARLLSLLPPLHIALLPASRMLATLGEALKTVARPLPGVVTFVTGPSRTADIEMQLVVGVHGPGALHVVLV